MNVFLKTNFGHGNEYRDYEGVRLPHLKEERVSNVPHGEDQAPEVCVASLPISSSVWRPLVPEEVYRVEEVLAWDLNRSFLFHEIGDAAQGSW